MQDIIDLFTQYSNLAYGILFLYSLGGGMVAILAAGLLASSGALDISLCIIIAMIANFIGDEILFYVARYNKSQILPYFRSHRRKLALAQILFKSYGVKIILAKKYIYGLKTLIPLAIGLTKYNAKKFLIINAISAFIWSLSLGLLATFAGDMIYALNSHFGENKTFIIIGILLILLLLWLYFSKITKKTNLY